MQVGLSGQRCLCRETFFFARIFGKKAFAGLGPGELLLRFELLGSCWTLFRGKIREKLWKMSA